MNIAFTICSNNYLARAKVVADTFILKHPENKFFFFLVDKIDPNLNYESLTNYQLIEIGKVVPDIEELAKKYNIIELNTAVKPSVFLYLFNLFHDATVIYLDPDLMIFDRFTEVEEGLKNDNINVIVTPHFCSPIDDGKYPSEIDFALYGLYNLGFIAIKNSEESQRFLLWWHERLKKYCYMRPQEGMFTDQLWVNYAPLFFNGVFVLKDLGYNVANWNLYERVITKEEDAFFINRQYKLKFFHFSHYQFNDPYILSKYQNRHYIKDLPDVKALIDIYQAALIQNKQNDFSKSPCYYVKLYQSHQAQVKAQEDLVYYTFKRKVINKITGLLNHIIPD